MKIARVTGQKPNVWVLLDPQSNGEGLFLCLYTAVMERDPAKLMLVHLDFYGAELKKQALRLLYRTVRIITEKRAV